MPQQHISWDRVEKEAVAILSKYIQINTTNPPGNETEGAKFLKEILHKEHIHSDIYESRPGRGSLISRYCGAENIPKIILLHHIDVVPAEEEKWHCSPFSGAIEDGEIWGRGAIDCKSLGVMELMALLLLKREGLAPEKHFVLAATADEEAGGGLGVEWLMDRHPEKLQTQYVINEGMGLGFSTGEKNLYFCQVAEKGANWIRITFEGRPGHASQPHGDNCVAEMSRALDVLSAHTSPFRITAPVKKLIQGIAPEQRFMPQEEFLALLDESRCKDILERIPLQPLRQMLSALLHNTVLPTVVRAGSKTNVIPSQCYCEVDCRILPGSTPEELQQHITELLMSRQCKNFSVEFKGKSLPSESSAETALFTALSASFKKCDPKAKVIPYMSSGATDSRFFRQQGIVAYGLQIETSIEAIERIHGHNERITIPQLTKGIKILYDVLKKFIGSIS